MINQDTGLDLSPSEVMESLSIGAVEDFIKVKHGDQKRMDGSPYYLHPVAVANILYNWLEEAHAYRLADFNIWAEQLNYHNGHENYSQITKKLVKAALCHDVLEDTNVTPKELAVEIGTMATEWVQFVTKPPKDPAINKSWAAYYAYSKLANVPDAIKWMKLADRYHNLCDMRKANMTFRERYLTDTQMLLTLINMPFTAYPMQKVVAKYWEECKAFYDEWKTK